MHEEFKYLDSEGMPGLPQLVLAIDAKYTYGYPEEAGKKQWHPDWPVFKPGRDWFKLAHQTAGGACNQRYMYATLLKPKNDTVALGMLQLSNRYLGSDIGWFEGPTLEELIEYSNALKVFLKDDQITCNYCCRDFEEAIYPIDVSHLHRLAADDLPKDLDGLVESTGKLDYMTFFTDFVHYRWNLYILGENCD